MKQVSDNCGMGDAVNEQIKKLIDNIHGLED